MPFLSFPALAWLGFLRPFRVADRYCFVTFFKIDVPVLLLAAVHAGACLAIQLFSRIGLTRLRIARVGLLVLLNDVVLLTGLPLRACCVGFVETAAIVHDELLRFRLLTAVLCIACPGPYARIK